MAMQTTIGIFSSQAEAERAIRDLHAAGYRDDQFGMIGKNTVEMNGRSRR